MFTYWSSLSRPWLMQKFRKQKFAAHARRVRTIGLHGGDDLLTLVMERDCIACAAQGGRRGTRWKGGAGREGAHEECDKCRALARQESDIPTGLARELEMSEENPFEEERAWRSMALPGKYLYNQIRA